MQTPTQKPLGRAPVSICLFSQNSACTSYHIRCEDPASYTSCNWSSLHLQLNRSRRSQQHQRRPPPRPFQNKSFCSRRRHRQHALLLTAYNRMHIPNVLIFFDQVIIQLDLVAPFIVLESAPSPIPFNAADLRAGKKQLHNTKSVSFAPLPSPWRHGTNLLLLLDQW